MNEENKSVFLKKLKKWNKKNQKNEKEYIQFKVECQKNMVCKITFDIVLTVNSMLRSSVENKP